MKLVWLFSVLSERDTVWYNHLWETRPAWGRWKTDCEKLVFQLTAIHCPTWLNVVRLMHCGPRTTGRRHNELPPNAAPRYSRILLLMMSFLQPWRSGTRRYITGSVVRWTKKSPQTFRQSTFYRSQKCEIWPRFSNPVAIDVLWFWNREKSKTSEM